MGRRIGIFLSIVLAAAALLFFRSIFTQRNTEIDHYAALKQQAAPYEEELAELQNQIDQSKKDYERQLKSTGTIEVLFSELHENLYYFAYPQMERHNLVGMVVLGKQWPGDDGCISKGEFQELINSGWGYALCWDEDNEWLEDAMEKLRELGLELPSALYFPEGEYSDGRRDAAAQFTVFLHHGETGQSMLVTKAGDARWELGVGVWDYSTVARDIRLTTEKAGNRVYEVTFTLPLTEEPEESEEPTEEATEHDERYRSSLYNEEYFPAFLDALSSHVADETLVVTDFDKAWLLRKNADGKNAEMTSELESKLSQYEERMKALEEKIDQIYSES